MLDPGLGIQHDNYKYSTHMILYYFILPTYLVYIVLYSDL